MNWIIKRTAHSGNRRDFAFGMLIIRLGIAFTMIRGHGFSKINHFDEMLANFGDPIGIGITATVVLVIFAEVFCSILIGFGLFTRIAAIPLIITMLVATYIANGGADFAVQEKGLMYLIIYIGIFFAGPGKYSFDAAMRK